MNFTTHIIQQQTMIESRDLAAVLGLFSDEVQSALVHFALKEGQTHAVVLRDGRVYAGFRPVKAFFKAVGIEHAKSRAVLAALGHEVVL